MSQTLIGLPVRLGSIKDATTSLFLPTAPNDSTVYVNPRWYVLATGGTGNKDFDYALKGPRSFCLATKNMAHS